jgi:hypothetical protein
LYNAITVTLEHHQFLCNTRFLIVKMKEIKYVKYYQSNQGKCHVIKIFPNNMQIIGDDISYMPVSSVVDYLGCISFFRAKYQLLWMNIICC